MVYVHPRWAPTSSETSDFVEFAYGALPKGCSLAQVTHQQLHHLKVLFQMEEHVMNIPYNAVFHSPRSLIAGNMSDS